MTPKEYYYNQFPDDLRTLLNKIEVGGDGHFHLIELCTDFNSGQEDRLSHIPKDRMPFFLSALSFTILIDQVMYTHFKSDYPAFKSMTLYPKATWNLGYCINVKPWQFFDHRIALNRGVRNPKKIENFIEFARFFVEDLQEFFRDNKFIEANWEIIKAAMLNDKDIVEYNHDGDYGKEFKRVLEGKTDYNPNIKTAWIYGSRSY